MNWFKNLKIRTKLLIGFGSMCLLLILLALVGYQTLAEMQDTERNLVETSREFASMAREARADQNRIRAGMLEYLISTDATQRAELKKEIEERSKEVSASVLRIKEYLAAQKLTEELVAISELERELEAYRDGRNEQFKEVAAGRQQAALAQSAGGAQDERFERVRAALVLVGDGLNDLADEAVVTSTELFNDAVRVFIATALVSLLFGLFMVWLMNRLIAAPMQRVTAIAERIRLGDLSVQVEATDRSDEVGALLRAFRLMVEKLQNFAKAAERVAGGDLSVRFEGDHETDTLQRALKTMVENLRETHGELRNGFGILATSSTEILATVSQVAASATETATAVSETSTTAEEVKQTAHLSNQKAKAVQDTAQRTAAVSDAGRKAVADTLEGMNRIQDQMESIAESVVRLSEQGQTIGEIIATVNDLAEQSNLLAVNAAIEATRAGEFGKGFAVVAQEVKSLAEQSRQATTQVRTILMEVQKATSAAVMATEQGTKAVAAGVRQATDAGESIRTLSGSVGEAAQAAIQIAASSQQQLVGMDQIASAISNIRQATTQNSVGIKQLEASAQGLQALGGRLKVLVEKQRLEG